MKHEVEFRVLLCALFYLCIPLFLPLTTSQFAIEDRPFRAGARVLAPFTVACVFCLALSSGILRMVLGALILLYAQKEYPIYTAGKVEEDYLNAINIFMFSLKFIDFVYLRTPEDAAHRLDPSGNPVDDPNSLRSATYWERLKWSTSLFSTLRGIGWNWRVRNVEEIPRGSRSAFVLRQAIGALYSYLAIDFLAYHLTKHPLTLSPCAAGYFALPLQSQVLLAWMMVFRSGFEMGVSYYLASGLVVGLRISDPDSWPPFFGSFVKGYTLRSIWGKCWHQNLRRTFESYSTLLCRSLGVQQGSAGSSYLKLYFSFLLSACIHNIGSMNNPYTAAVQYQFLFFLLQPVAITIEDIVCLYGGNGGDHRSRNGGGMATPTVSQRVVGYTWVFCFLSFSLRYMAAYTFACGFAGLEHPLIKVFSVATRMLG